MRKSSVKFSLLRFVLAAQGNAGVEFALLLPLLALLLFGGIEIGRALHDFHVVNETVRDAARYLSQNGADCSAAGVGAGTLKDGPLGSAADLEKRAKALAITGNTNFTSPSSGLLGNWNYPDDASTVTIRVDCIDNTAAEFGGMYEGSSFVPHIVVIADVPFSFLFGGLIVSDPTITITLSHNVAVTGVKFQPLPEL